MTIFAFSFWIGMNKESISGIIKTIGPGILFAGAAIGGSHLIQSTRAGADYGFTLLWIVILINLFKYPFFEFSYRYTATTGRSLLEAYNDLGRWVLIAFTAISIVTGIINIAALALVSAGLAGFILGGTVDPLILSIGLVLICLIILVVGKYPALDKFMKLMVVILSICTTIAFVMAVGKGQNISTDFTPADIYTKAGIVFIIALMGWMPAPIEISAWTSLWALSRSKQKKHIPTLKESLIDFHIGYFTTTILAVFFLTLGATLMYGTGMQFSASGAVFSNQLISLYTDLFGKWATFIIAPAAFITMFSSLITVMDGYPRAITGSLFLLNSKIDQWRINLYFVIMLILSAIGLLIVSFFAKNMKLMIDIATIISFLAAPVMAIFNYRVVTTRYFPESGKVPKWLRLLAWLGIIFLSGFSLIYLWTLFFLD